MPFQLAKYNLRDYLSLLMKIDIRRYLSLRDSLLKEKSNLEVRLREINQALGQTPTMSAASSVSSSTPRGGQRGPRRGLSLRDAVLQVTANAPLAKEEILRRVQALGYRFSTKNPLNSLGVILYGKNPKFRNVDGKFSVSGKAAGASAQASPGGSRPGGRRKMSPEARARIAAAQRARWAKAKAGK